MRSFPLCPILDHGSPLNLALLFSPFSLATLSTCSHFTLNPQIGNAPPRCTYEMVRLADMDGDGRVDFCIITQSGDINCQRNGGVGTTTAPIAEFGGYWQDFSTGADSWTNKFPTQNKGSTAGVNLVDLNGDFKADWLYMDETGM